MASRMAGMVRHLGDVSVLIATEHLSLVPHLAEFVQWVTVTTGYEVVDNVPLAPLGVKIDHCRKTIHIHSGLDPAAFCTVLSRACTRILRGPGAAPEFRDRLRLIQGGGDASAVTGECSSGA